MVRLVTLFVFLVFAAGCTKKKAAAPANPVEEGRAFYATHCTACHSPDPKKDGALGPAVYGSSLELIEARVLQAKYPPGYTPKRNTHIMTALPFLKDNIPALHAYLNAP